MPKKNNAITIACRYFKWRLRLKKSGIWQADGRGGNKLNVGRHSLGTRDLDEAMCELHRLDEKMAAEHGLISYRNLFSRTEFNLTVEAGFAAYQKHIERPRAAGGPKKTTAKRYGRVLRAFREFLASNQIQFCEQITKQVLDEFATHRSTMWKDSTVKLELVTVRTFLNFLRETKLLSPDCYFRYRTKKTRKKRVRYCPHHKEVRAILELLKSNPKLQWLFHAVMMSVCAGLRLGEIAQMTSHDVCLDLGIIRIPDEEEDEESQKETKNGESRFVPITSELRPILEKIVTREDRKLFTGPRGGHLRSDTFNDNLRSKALVPLKDTFPKLKFQSLVAHGLRHFFRTHATHCDISKTEIDAWMAHDENSMSQHYYHPDIEAACESIKKFRPLISDKSDDEFDNSAGHEYNADTSHHDVEDDLNINPEDHDPDTGTKNQ